MTEEKLEVSTATKGKITKLEKFSLHVTISTPEEEVTASEKLALVVEARKNLETQRKFFVQPLNKHVKDINAFFKQYSGRVDKTEKSIKEAIKAYRAAVRLAEQENEDDLAPSTIEPPKKTKGGKTVGSSFRWIFEVEDASKVPADYMIPDEKKIKAAVDGGIRAIPGVRIYEDEVISVR